MTAPTHYHFGALDVAIAGDDCADCLPDSDPCPRCGGDHDRIDRREPCPTDAPALPINGDGLDFDSRDRDGRDEPEPIYSTSRARIYRDLEPDADPHAIADFETTAERGVVFYSAERYDTFERTWYTTTQTAAPMHDLALRSDALAAAIESLDADGDTTLRGYLFGSHLDGEHPVEWRDRQTAAPSRFIPLFEAARRLEGYGHVHAKRQLLDGATLRTPFAYYRISPDALAAGGSAGGPMTTRTFYRPTFRDDAVGTFATVAVIADDKPAAIAEARRIADRYGYRTVDVAHATPQSADEYVVELQVKKETPR